MLKRRRGLRLAQEALLGLGVVQQVRRQELQRHRALERRVLGLVHLAHAALAQLLDDAVVADRLADHNRTILPRLPREGYLAISAGYSLTIRPVAPTKPLNLHGRPLLKLPNH